MTMPVNQVSEVGTHYRVGDIQVWDSDPQSPLPQVVMLHPNSTCRHFFKKQMEDKSLTRLYRLLAFDLPGHGDSLKADDPMSAYNFPGYAKACAKTIATLGLKKFVLLGWSLGGCVAMELLDQLPGLRGVVLTGAPPVAARMDVMMRTFEKIPANILKIFAKPDFTPEEAALFASPIGTEKWMIEATLKTDGLARSCLAASLQAGVGRDQRELVANSKVPTALICGKLDPIIDEAYLQSLRFGNLWDMHLIEGADHGVVYKNPAAFNPLLSAFLEKAFSRS